MKTSNLGRSFIKNFESLKLKAYKDPPGIWTIGYGHTKGVCPGQEINEMEAELMLTSDLQPPEGVLNAELPLLLQTEFDALVSFSFNVGISAFRKSTLFKRVYSGETELAGKEFSRWDKTKENGKTIILPGLTKRRLKERDLFLFGVY